MTDMTEPVAYMISDSLGALTEVMPAWRLNDFRHLNGDRWTLTPLYTHPPAPGEPVAYTSAAALDAISEGRCAWMFPGDGPASIPLYAHQPLAAQTPPEGVQAIDRRSE